LAVLILDWPSDGSLLIYSRPAAGGIVETVRVVADSAGSIYVAGNVVKDRWVLFPGALNPTSDAFVTRLDRDGNTLWTTYLAGAKGDRANGLAVDAAGNAYVGGVTTSSDFPIANAFQRQLCTSAQSGLPSPCGFVAKLDARGRIVYSTYLGGQGQNSVNAVAADSSGSAYVTGETNAINYPTTPGALIPSVPRTSFFPPSYAFVSRLSPSGDALTYSTYLGGAGAHCEGGSRCVGVVGMSWGTAIALDAAGNAYVAGVTSAINFPVTAGAFQTECRCSSAKIRTAYDGFIAKLNTGGTALLYSTYLGGTPYGPASDLLEGTDAPRTIAVDPAGNAYVAGLTTSHDFPVTAGALQQEFRGCTDVNCFERLGIGFVSKLDPAGKSLLYSTYLGGRSAEVNGLALDEQGNAWLAGANAGTDFPVTAGGFPRGGDFLAQLNASGSAVISGTQFPQGVSGADIARDALGRLYVVGGDSGLVSRAGASGSAAPEVLGVGNAAGGPVTARVAPGELISIYGINIGPAAPAGVRLDAGGRVDTNLNGVRVFFNGLVAPLLYAQLDQINAVVPYGIAGWSETLLEVVQNDIIVASMRLAVVEAEPEIFRGADGQSAAALNQDGSINSQENRATPSSIVVLYVTGDGPTEPRVADGQINRGTLPRPKLPVSVEIDGNPAEILYAGAAPGQVAGLMQLNARLPAEYSSDALPVILRVGSGVSHSVVVQVGR
jgi:uncharacterized protein (TIGR03437 family)